MLDMSWHPWYSYHKVEKTETILTESEEETSDDDANE
jgi:hypothetical protein